MDQPRIIGLAGKRGVGKSTVADYLCTKGFVKAHAFDGGKYAAEAYFIHYGATPDTAYRMAYGDLRDVPSSILPGNAKPRFFLEKFGKFMGTVMGPEWTLLMEIKRIRRFNSVSRIVTESIVYEADALRTAGGIIIRIDRPDHDGPAGEETDSFGATIVPDCVVLNTGTLQELCSAVAAIAGV